MKNIITACSLSLGLTLASSATLAANSFPVTVAPECAELYFISPQNGDQVTSPFTVQFGLKGISIAPAAFEKANTGHHHLLSNVKVLPSARPPISADKQKV